MKVRSTSVLWSSDPPSLFSCVETTREERGTNTRLKPKWSGCHEGSKPHTPSSSKLPSSNSLYEFDLTMKEVLDRNFERPELSINFN